MCKGGGWADEGHDDAAYQSLPISGRVAMTFSCTGLIVSNFISFNAARRAGSTLPFKALKDMASDGMGTDGMVAAVVVGMLAMNRGEGSRKRKMEDCGLVAEVRGRISGLRTKRGIVVIPPIPRCTESVDRIAGPFRHCGNSNRESVLL